MPGSNAKACFKLEIASSSLPSAAKAAPWVTNASVRLGTSFRTIAALGDRFGSISGGQQSIGQFEMCWQVGGVQPKDLAELDDGSIVLASASKRFRQPIVSLRDAWRETHCLFVMCDRLVDVPLLKQSIRQDRMGDGGHLGIEIIDRRSFAELGDCFLDSALPAVSHAEVMVSRHVLVGASERTRPERFRIAPVGSLTPCHGGKHEHRRAGHDRKRPLPPGRRLARLSGLIDVHTPQATAIDKPI